MLQQRKLAWTERKKKPKIEMTAGKCGANSGKFPSHAASRFHKNSSYRQHEGSKMAHGEGAPSGFVLKGAPGGGRTLRKCSLAVNSFLPPIKSVAMESNLSLKMKQSTMLYGETVVREPMDGIAWGAEELSKSQHKEALPCASSPGCMLSQSVNLPVSWEDKPFVVKDLVDFMRPPAKKAPTPDLYKSCLLVLSSRIDDGIESKARIPDTFRSLAERSQASRTTRRDLTRWRNSKGLKGGEKLSSGDSAFGTDSCSETVEVDLELGWEVGSVEMDHYTQQRIISWILQVNAALFSSSTDSVQCPLTEQDTSIKIVYDGD